MTRKKARWVNITDLPFISILDARPRHEQFVLIAWEMKGYAGFESIYWDKDDFRCSYCVAWLPLEFNHVFTNKCAISLRKNPKLSPVILRWSKHFSKHYNGEYIPQDKQPRYAEKM